MSTTFEVKKSHGETGSDFAWKVIVLNDNHNTFEGMSIILAHVLAISVDKGFKFAQMVHFTGQAVVWSGHKELAEHYHSQLAAYGLTMAELTK